MITLTTEIKSRRFKDYEKQNLYRYLRKPFMEKRDEIRETFSEYLDNNVLGLILDPELLLLGGKPYCKKRINRFIISPVDLGLDEKYIGLPNFSKCNIGLQFDYTSRKYMYAVSSGIYSLNITQMIINVCPKEIIEQIKYFMYEAAKAEFDFNFYGLGTFVKPDYSYYSHYGLFQGLNTWGNLYSKSPEMFETLYKLCNGTEIVEETLDPEKKLLLELKSSLGY